MKHLGAQRRGDTDEKDRRRIHLLCGFLKWGLPLVQIIWTDSALLTLLCCPIIRASCPPLFHAFPVRRCISEGAKSSFEHLPGFFPSLGSEQHASNETSHRPDK